MQIQRSAFLDDGMLHAGDFKSGTVLIEGFFHIKAMAYFCMCTFESKVMCTLKQYMY